MRRLITHFTDEAQRLNDMLRSGGLELGFGPNEADPKPLVFAPAQELQSEAGQVGIRTAETMAKWGGSIYLGGGQRRSVLSNAALQEREFLRIQIIAENPGFRVDSPNAEILPIPGTGKVSENPRKHVTEDWTLRETGNDIVSNPFVSYMWKLRPWEGPEPS